MLFSKRNYILHFDWIHFCITFTLGLIGLFFIMSATYSPEQPYSLFFKKQLFGLISGFIIYFIATISDYRTLMRYGYFAYFCLILLLIFTIIKGSIGMGAQRWISIGFIKLQPSELCKLLLPAFISYYFYTHNKQKSAYEYTLMLIAIFITTLLILKQPDLGTAILILLSGILLLLHTGFKRKWLSYLLLVAIICAPFAWQMLKPYQKKRVLVFLGEGEAHKERYQIEQSKIAIGSGGSFGKGYRKGTQNIFQFLPESRTDFIFAVIAEEWGFFGALGILLLYLLLFLRLLSQVGLIDDANIQLLALGLIIHTILSTYINIFMVLGLLPIVGIPLPLMSYGLSNLWAVLASLGWFHGIMIQRHLR